MNNDVLQNYARGNDFEDWKKVYFQRKKSKIISYFGKIFLIRSLYTGLNEMSVNEGEGW